MAARTSHLLVQSGGGISCVAAGTLLLAPVPGRSRKPATRTQSLAVMMERLWKTLCSGSNSRDSAGREDRSGRNDVGNDAIATCSRA